MIRRKPHPSPERPAFALPTVRPVSTYRMATAADLTGARPYSPAESATVKRAPRAHTRAESAHLARVKGLGCVLCARLGLTQESSTSAHHIRTGMGAQERAPDWLTVALCEFGCHQGDSGIHRSQARLRQAKCTELDLLADTLRELFAGAT